MTRKIVFNMTISLDGRITGSDGNEDMEWVVPHALTDEVRDLLDRSVRTATTAGMGSVNADGFAVVWPPVRTTRVWRSTSSGRRTRSAPSR